VREKRPDASVTDSEMPRRNLTSTTVSKSQAVAANVVAEAVAAVIVVTVVVEVADVATLVTVATAKVDIGDVATASEDVENVGSEVNIVVAAAVAVVARLEKVRLLRSAMRMPSHLSAAGRSDDNTGFKKATAGRYKRKAAICGLQQSGLDGHGPCNLRTASWSILDLRPKDVQGDFILLMGHAVYVQY
jgi:hypothetical protein